MPGTKVSEDAGVAEAGDPGDLPEGKVIVLPEPVNLTPGFEVS